MKRIVVLISGRGSNLLALLQTELGGRIERVISNNPSAKGLEIARSHGVACDVVDHRNFPDREQFDQTLAEKIEAAHPDLIVLAGFMRILTEAFIQRFPGRIINIHPSLLPAFPGTHTHARALKEGVKVHGCTVHFVTPALDHGPIIVQAVVPVVQRDDEATLAARVLESEHRVLAQAIRWFLADRLSVVEGRVILDDASSPTTTMMSPELC